MYITTYDFMKEVRSNISIVILAQIFSPGFTIKFQALVSKDVTLHVRHRIWSRLDLTSFDCLWLIAYKKLCLFIVSFTCALRIALSHLKYWGGSDLKGLWTYQGEFGWEIDMFNLTFFI